MRFYLLILSFLLVSSSLVAQKAPTITLWNSLAAKVKFSDKFNLKIDQQIRTEFSPTLNLNKALINFEGHYNIQKWAWVSLGYRFTSLPTANRFYGGFGMKHTFEKLDLTIKGRLRGQFEKKIAKTDWEIHTRLRSFLIYNPSQSEVSKRFKFILYGEVWYQFEPQSHDFSRFRIGLGTSYALSKQVAIALMYRYQNGFITAKEQTVHILFLQLGYKFNTQKKK